MNAKPGNRWHNWPVDVGGAGAFVALTLLFYLAGVQPISRQHAVRLRDRAELEARQDQAAKLAVAADTLERRLKKVGQALDDAPVQLQSARQLNQRLAQLTSLAAQCGLAIDQTQSDRPHSDRWYQTVPIRLAGQGAYPTCATFLDRLRRTFAEMGVSSFELASQPGGDAPATFRFDLVWYTQPKPSG